jgi:hypothetical protein
LITALLDCLIREAPVAIQSRWSLDSHGLTPETATVAPGLSLNLGKAMLGLLRADHFLLNSNDSPRLRLPSKAQHHLEYPLCVPFGFVSVYVMGNSATKSLPSAVTLGGFRIE